MVLELESNPGGTSRSGSSPVTTLSLGMHYVPVPMRENRSLIALLREMNVIERLDEKGAPVVREEFLCRDPSERVFCDGQWLEGQYPTEGAAARDLAELAQFRAEIGRWAAWRDKRGRRAFAIPIANGSDHADVTSLDALSMAERLRSRGCDSERLHWLVDYSCRDDYGSTSDETSAWAGLVYFASSASRTRAADSQPIITWPEGNGRIVHAPCRSGRRCTCAAGRRVLKSRGRKLRRPKIETSSKSPPSTRGRKRRSDFAPAA